MKSLKKIIRLNSILFIIFFFILSSCRKDCEICTQMVSEKYIPTRSGYPKTTTSKYNSCGPNNSWISEQVNMETYKFHDTTFYKIISTDCQ